MSFVNTILCGETCFGRKRKWNLCIEAETLGECQSAEKKAISNLCDFAINIGI